MTSISSYFPYTVQHSDTLERVAARFDCTPSELMKLNKLPSRLVFPGKVLKIPDHADVAEVSKVSPLSDPVRSEAQFSSPNELLSETTEKPAFIPPSLASVHFPPEPTALSHWSEKQRNSQSSFGSGSPTLWSSTKHAQSLDVASLDSPEHGLAPPGTPRKKHSMPTGGVKIPTPEDEMDEECLQRFIKLQVKHFTDEEGTINGVLLVTPNCLMFDPDLSHPLVKENGPERYGMMAKMEHLVSAALFKDISAMTHEKPVTDDDVFGAVDHEKFVSERRASDVKQEVVGSILADDKMSNEAPIDEKIGALCMDRSEEVSDKCSENPISSHPGLEKSLSSASRRGGSLSSDSHAPDQQNIHGPGLAVRTIPSVMCEDTQLLASSLPDSFFRHNPSAPSFTMQIQNPPDPISENNVLLSTTMLSPQRRHKSDSDLLDEKDEQDFANDRRASDQYLAPDISLNTSSKQQSLLIYSCPSSIERNSDERLIIDDVIGGDSTRRRPNSDSFQPDASELTAPTLSTSSTGVGLAVDGNNRPIGLHGSIKGRFRSLRSSLKHTQKEKQERIGRLRHNLTKQVSVTAQTAAGAISSGASTVGGAISAGAGAVATGAQNVGGAMVSGAQNVGGAMVSGAQNVGGVVVTGAQNVGGAVVTGAHSVGGAIVAMPSNIAQVPRNFVNTATGLFDSDLHESWFGEPDDPSRNLGAGEDPLNQRDRLKSEIESRRKKSYAKLEALKAKALQARVETQSKYRLHFTCATGREEGPDLTTPIEEMVAPLGHAPITTEMPLFLCLKLDKKKRRKDAQAKSSSSVTVPFRNYAKAEFWFTVPKEKADSLYMFFVQWSPEKYGGPEDSAIPLEQDVLGVGHEGFVVIDSEEDDVSLTREEGSPYGPGSLGSLRPGSYLNREWEIVTVEEVKRRLSLQELADVTKFPLPSGSAESTLLSEDMIRQLVTVLPARAEGYPWVSIYSTSEHGFSLRTLYRNMEAWGEEMSPTLLVVKDTAQRTFGAIVNCPLVASEHFYGSGESLLFTFHPEFTEYRWTGENNFFVKGNRDSLGIGSSGGHFGLWLDSDLYHGSTQACATFDNAPLTDSQDFIIAGIEAWGFSMAELY